MKRLLPISSFNWKFKKACLKIIWSKWSLVMLAMYVIEIKKASIEYNLKRSVSFVIYYAWDRNTICQMTKNIA